MQLDKPERIRSRKIIQSIREEAEYRCQYENPMTGERCDHPAEGEPHHIRTRGSGGDDRRENQIQLCGIHHKMFHDGNLNRNELIRIVAKREGKTPEEIADIIKLPYQEPPSPPPQPPKLEDLVQAYIQIDEQEQENRFVKGQLLDAMLAAGATQKYLASEIGVSASQIRELVHVYKTFPTPESRVPTLSWYHHRVAARSNDPEKFLAMAADHPISVRELKKEILKEEGADHIASQEEDQERKKAEKLLGEVQMLLDTRSSASDWLFERLQHLIMGRRKEVVA